MYCPNCGSELKEVGDFSKFWFKAYKCKKSNDSFIEVMDMRWIYPLQNLEKGIIQTLETTDDATIEKAFSRIKRIDYKTISIAFFEKTILNIYDENEEYKVIYPEKEI